MKKHASILSVISLILFLFILVSPMGVYANATPEENANADKEKESIAYQIAYEAFSSSKTPGLAGFIRSPEESTLFGMGTLNREKNIPVEVQDPTQVFQLASVSKAFTGLAVLLLQEEGELSLDNPVTDYLPWFHVIYQDEKAELTLAHLLHHTSGLTNGYISLLPEGSGDDALELTVRAFVGTTLMFAPGERMEYGTMNYDILGLIIQEISGLPYEEFMRQRIFEPLELFNTYAGIQFVPENATLASGYKIRFLTPSLYDAPVYRGNTPAGYICSSAQDMRRWADLQMRIITAPEPFDKLIEQSHVPDKSVAAVNGSYYAAGWFVSEDGNTIEHSGGNPNFATQIVLLMNENSSFCVLTNATSINMDNLVDNLTAAITQNEIRSYKVGGLQIMDIVFSIVALISLLTLLFLVYRIILLCRRKSKQLGKSIKSPRVIISFVITILLLFLCFLGPTLANYSWYLAFVWMPQSLSVAALLLCVLSIAAFINIFLSGACKKCNK